MAYLLDTNIISELIRKNPNTHVIKWLESIPETHLYLSVLTIGEIKKGIEKLPDSHKKQKYKIWLEHTVLNRFGERLLDINVNVAERWGRLLAEENRPLSAINSLIAATALHYDLTLVTRNIKDYSFSSLETINPY